MKRHNSTIGTRINLFDNLDEQTVDVFNSMFTECPIRGDFSPDDPVMIGEPASGNCRFISVGEKLLTHKMYSDILYTMDRDEYYMGEDTEAEDIMGIPV